MDQMEMDRVDDFVKAVNRYVRVTESRVLSYGTEPLSAMVTKSGLWPVSFRLFAARELGLRLYPGEKSDLLTMRGALLSSAASRGRLNAEDSRPGAEAHAPTEPRAPRPPAVA
jgi:hypothetical protein